MKPKKEKNKQTIGADEETKSNEIRKKKHSRHLSFSLFSFGIFFSMILFFFSNEMGVAVVHHNLRSGDGSRQVIGQK